MPIRTVKQHSDRGKIKNLPTSPSVLAANSQVGDIDIAPTSYELRMKQLYETAKDNKALQAACGFITTDYIADKNAIPLSVYRIRQIVNDIKSKAGNSINLLTQEMSGYIQGEIGAEASEYIDKRAFVKTASRKKPSFWRVSKS